MPPPRRKQTTKRIGWRRPRRANFVDYDHHRRDMHESGRRVRQSFTIAPGPNDTINKHVASGQYLNRSHYVETAIELLDTLLERRNLQRQPHKGATS
jgi:hypothetical protein